MTTTIITKHSATAKDPQPSQLERGELAIDLERKNIYTKDSSDEVVQLGGRPVKIGSTAPPTPQEGDLWMEVPTAVDEPAMMWVYDGDKWLEHPSGVDGAAGADGADGNIADATEQGVVATWDNTANAGAGQWTPDSSITIDSTGNVGIGTSSPSSPLNVVGNARFQKTGVGGLTLKIEDDTESGTGKGRVGIQLHNTAPDFFIGATPGSGLGGNQPNATYNGYTHTFQTSGNDRLTIDSSGNATFSGSVTADAMSLAGYCGLRTASGTDVVPTDGSGAGDSDAIDLGSTVYKFKNGYFSGTVYANGSPLTRTRDLIDTLSTLRNATKDETTLEGLRDAIGNAVGGLIEKFEAMQNEAVTQDIQESPATQEISNED